MHAVLLASALPTLAACADAPSVPDSPAIVASVIVKPRVPTSGDEVLHAARERLGAEAGVRYARPMAGGSHILYLTEPATRAQVPALVERLRTSDLFQYVELDSIMRIQ